MISVSIKLSKKIEEYLEGRARRLGSGAKVRVGFLEGATYPDGTSVALVAAVQNFGAPSRGIPPRPFFTNTIKDHQDEWPGVIEASLQAENYDAKEAMRWVGEHVAGEIRQGITDTNDPPLKPATIKRKGFAKPLVDTGVLRASVDYEIE